MKAKRVVMRRRGSPDVIDIETYDVPEPTDDEVRIKVTYGGLAFADVMLRKVSLPGLPNPPLVPGADLVGTIDAVGSGVTSLRVGDRAAVLLMSDFGAQTQYICVSQRRVVVVPDAVPLEKAACLPINYLTAYRMFSSFCGKLDAGARILVHGGSGGVGSALIQLAVSAGMHVVSTVSEQNRSFVTALGASPVDYRRERFEAVVHAGGKVDAVFDPVGGAYLRRSLTVLKAGGIYVGYGFQSGMEKGVLGIAVSMLQFVIAKLFHRRKVITSFQLRYRAPYDYVDDLRNVFQMYIAGKIDPAISEIVPLHDARRAHRDLEAGRRSGKILIAM